MAEKEQNPHQVQTPQSTQIYHQIRVLMNITVDIYEKAAKSTRYLTVNSLWNTLVEMASLYCMGFTTKDNETKLSYLNQARTLYFSVDTMFQILIDKKVISIGFGGEIAKTSLLPLINQIDAFIKSIETKL